LIQVVDANCSFELVDAVDHFLETILTKESMLLLLRFKSGSPTWVVRRFRVLPPQSDT
jgi:hypothetical protein